MTYWFLNDVLRGEAESNPYETGEAIFPTARKTLRLLRALQAGERITVAKALTDYGVYALSQEAGRLRKLGWPVQSDRVQVSPGAWVKEYFLNAPLLADNTEQGPSYFSATEMSLFTRR